MENYTIIKYNTRKCSKIKKSMYGNFISCSYVPDVPGKKIDDYRKLLKKQKIKFTEKPCADGMEFYF